MTASKKYNRIFFRVCTGHFFISNIISEIKSRPILTNHIIDLFKEKPNIFEINKKYLTNEGLKRSLEQDKKFLNNKT